MSLQAFDRLLQDLYGKNKLLGNALLLATDFKQTLTVISNRNQRTEEIFVLNTLLCGDTINKVLKFIISIRYVFNCKTIEIFSSQLRKLGTKSEFEITEITEKVFLNF